MAATAVRYCLRHEIGNFIEHDLKVITGAGKHSEGDPVLLPTIERLLREELSPPLPFDCEWALECHERSCELLVNRGCLVVAMHDLCSWMMETKPFDTYVVYFPATDSAPQ